MISNCRRRPAATPLVAALALVLHAAVAHAASGDHARITSLEVSGGDRAAAEVVVHGSAPLEFTIFRLSNPTRIVLDMPNADISGAKAPEVSGDSLISAVTTTQFQGKNGHVARVVVVLRGEVEFDAKNRGNAVVLTASPVAAREAPLALTHTPAPAAPVSQGTPVIELSGDDEAVADAKRLVGIKANERAGGSVVHITTDGVVGRYEIEEVDSPPRLVIDLFGVRADKGADRALTVPGLGRVRVGKHHDKTRVVLDGKDGVLPQYDVASTGEGLSIIFGAPSEMGDDGAVAGRLTELSVEEKNGFHRLSLTVGAAVAIRTVKDGPREKTVILEGVTLDDRIAGRHDLAKGPLEAAVISRAEHRPGAQVELLLSDDVEHSVWQRDGRVYWDVRVQGASAPMAAASLREDRPQPRAAPHTVTLAAAAQEGTAARRFRGKKITLDLMDADIVNVLRLLGDVSGKNVVVGDDVNGKVTIKLKNVPWDQALDVVLKTKGLDQEVRGGIIRVAPKAKLDAEREARLKLEEERRKKIPTTVRLIPVNYAVAQELTPQIKELLSERGRVTFDERTNVIIVEDIRENLEQAERLVRTLDTQTPQVLIEARMVEASTTFTRSLGIQWGGGLLFSERTGNPTGLIFPNNIGIVGGADTGGPQQATPGVLAPSNFAVNLPADDVTSGIGMNLGSIGNFGFLNARLTAAETTGQAKTISAPKVTTLNNKTARIFQGQDLLITTVTDNTQNTTTIQARLDLEVTPHVTADGSVLMKVALNNNAPNFQQTSGQNASINTKGAETELLVKDGDTAVIGGIYTRNFGEEYRETPFLGKIPLLGWLFKSYSARDERQEMLVFLTPRIINRRSATPGAALAP